ncbi:hypothetical protein AAMO2058_000513100 [Amorphochlora amoebiformis]
MLLNQKSCAEKDLRRLFEFIDLFPETVFSAPGFLRLSESIVVSLVARETLCIEELFVFRHCMRWAAAHHRREILESTSDDTDGGERKKARVVIPQAILRKIRFPVLDIEEFAAHVVPTGVLSEEQAVQIFKYMSDPPQSSSQNLSFPTTKRKGRSVKGLLRWDRSLRHPSLILCYDRLSVRSFIGQKQLIAGNFAFEGKGCHSFHIRILDITARRVGTDSIVIGVFRVPVITNIFAIPGQTDGLPGGWGVDDKNRGFAKDGKKIYKGSINPVWKTGDVMGVHIDSTKGHITFTHNKNDLGIKFTGVFGSLRPGIALRGEQQVILDLGDDVKASISSSFGASSFTPPTSTVTTRV